MRRKVVLMTSLAVCPPGTCHRTVSVANGSEPEDGVHSCQSTRYIASRSRTAGPAAWAGREISSSTCATRAPVESAVVTLTPSSPVGATRTRSARAPVANTETPRQENGSRVVPSPSPSSAAWTAASSSAGWMTNRSAAWSSGRTTSANSSSPRRHARWRPWNTGP